MFEHNHKVTINDEIYEYPAIKSAIRVKGQYKSFMRTYGVKRTKEEAIALVEEWENENPLMYKKRIVSNVQSKA